MDGWLHLARGPLFYAAVAFMLLGLARQLALTLWEAGRAYQRAGDRAIPTGQVGRGPPPGGSCPSVACATGGPTV